MGNRIPLKSIGCCLAAFLCLSVVPSLAQDVRSPETRAREAREYYERRVRTFVEDTYDFYEITGEMVSFRVHPGMTASELERIERLSEDLDDEAGRLLSFVTYIVPRVRGNTDDLWMIPPLEERSTLEERLTVILALVNRVEPKIQQLTALLTGEVEAAIEVDDLMVELALPFFIAGGLEELRALTRELRGSL